MSEAYRKHIAQCTTSKSLAQTNSCFCTHTNDVYYIYVLYVKKGLKGTLHRDSSGQLYSVCVGMRRKELSSLNIKIE
jgi:hypothetical protein